MLWYVVIDSLPGISTFSNTHIIEVYANQSVGETLYSLFIAPVAFQLWFLRDLMVMLLFTPVLWWIAKKQWLVALILAIASTFVYAWLIYFWLGIIVAVKQWDIENYERPKIAVLISALIYVGYAIYIAWGGTSASVVEVFVNIIGLYLVWSLYDIAARGRYMADKGLWKYLCGYSFFIYCFHEPAFNVIGEQVYCHFVVSALRDNKVGIALGWFDILVVHRFKHTFISVYYHLWGASTLYAVAVYYPDKAFIGIGIDKYLYVHHVAQFRLGKHKYAFEQNHIVRVEVHGLFLAGTSQERVGGHFYRFPLLEHIQMLEQQAPIECGRFIEIDFLTVFNRHVA